MIKLEERIEAFAALGNIITDYTQNKLTDNYLKNLIDKAILQARIHNTWFDNNNQLNALNEIGKSLEQDSLTQWIKAYPSSYFNPKVQKKVAVLMAGNIPLVGFHDILCVLIGGHKLIGKLSGDDKFLPPLIKDLMEEINPKLANEMLFTEEMLKHFDAIIATGSNNSSRYFDYYFGKYPNIIRKNRNSVAIISGNESDEEMQALGKDIFAYYGLGCRSISKLFIPENYDVDMIFKNMFNYKDVLNNVRYENNYRYHETLFLLNNEKFLTNGFLILRENLSYSSPVGVLHTETFTDISTLKNKINIDSDLLQCVVGQDYLSFGASQKPQLNDYADGIDTIKFLAHIS